MWWATLSFPSFVASSSSLSSYRNPRCSKIQASLFNYPLASKIMIRKELSDSGLTEKLIRDEPMKRLKGYAFIQFMSQDDAFLALETMDRRMYNGRMIYIDIAIPGKQDFQELPRTSGHPEKAHVPEESADDEVADCWYSLLASSSPNCN